MLMVISYVISKNWQWAGDALSNLATGFYGSIVVYYLVERSLEKSNERENIRRRKIAFNRIRRPLQDLLRFLWQLYKASRLKPDILPSNYEELFSDDYFDSIRYLDFKQNAPVTPRRSWMQYTPQVTNRIQSQFETIIDTYGSFLDTETLEKLEQVYNCHLFPYFRGFPAIIQVDIQERFQRHYLMLNGTHEMLREDIKNILQLLELTNSLLDAPISLSQDFSRDDVSPRWGVNRTDLEIG